MPYIVENGETRFVTQAEIDAYNKANPVGQSPDALFEELRRRNQAGTVPAGGNIVNITPNQAEIDNQKITVENGRGSLQDREQALERARTARASPTELAELQQNVDNQKRANAFNEETLATLQGQTPQELLVPNTTNTSPNQPLPETSQPYSGLVGVPPGADPEPPDRGDNDLVFANTGENLGVVDEAGFVTTSTGLNVLPEDIEPGVPDGYLVEFGADGDRVLNPQEVTAEQAQAEREFGARQLARQQAPIAAQRRQINNNDWRVRLRLAPQATYLYNAPQPGILAPLQVTDGVIFPYTPSIATAYKATYSEYVLTHSNYKGYFYQGSHVDAITLNATFTAQNTAEANYLLAVITFFKSVTKMFYGQDAERGAPPPLTYLSGLGEYQFNEHPCLVSQFNYTLPAEVDYIRAGSPNQLGTNLVTQRPRQSVTTGSLFGGLNRLAAALLTKGAVPNPPSPQSIALNRPTYVPTKMDIVLTLLPIQSRNQVSKQFSVKEFANGNLIKGGFW